jgi:hypothetical protein
MPPDHIAENGDHNNKIEQLENEKQTDDLKRSKEAQADAHATKNLSMCAVDVTSTSTGDFEFSYLLGDIKYHLDALYPRIGDAGKVWFSGKHDKDNGKIISIRFGRIGDNV